MFQRLSIRFPGKRLSAKHILCNEATNCFAEGYQEHGDGVSVDEDSDGGDSGSESGEVSMNSAELYDDSNNVLDIKYVRL